MKVHILAPTLTLAGLLVASVAFGQSQTRTRVAHSAPQSARFQHKDYHAAQSATAQPERIAKPAAPTQQAKPAQAAPGVQYGEAKVPESPIQIGNAREEDVLPHAVTADTQAEIANPSSR